MKLDDVQKTDKDELPLLIEHIQDRVSKELPNYKNLLHYQALLEEAKKLNT